MTLLEEMEDLLTRRMDQRETTAIVQAFIIALPVIKAAMAIEDQSHKPYTGGRTRTAYLLEKDLFTALAPWRKQA